MFTATPQLVDPRDRPGADIVIWDGKCKFCLQQVQRLRRWDSGDSLAYLSLHDSRTATLCPDLSFQQLMDQMWVVTPTGDKFGGADAVRYLSRKLPLLWWLRLPMHVPGLMPLWRWLYRQVARRRYRLLQNQDCDEGGTCHLHQ